MSKDVYHEKSLTGGMHPVVIIIENFYTNVMETRDFALKCDFNVEGNFPGMRTESFATTHIRDHFQSWLEPYGHTITHFPINKESYNGAFQLTTSRDRSWVHVDNHNNWAGVLYMTPDAPVSGGTGFYTYKGDRDIGANSQDMTKWELVDNVGNVFNRLILFNSHMFHSSMDYFGTCKEDGRLTQVFFFSTKKNDCEPKIDIKE